MEGDDTIGVEELIVVSLIELIVVACFVAADNGYNTEISTQTFPTKRTSAEGQGRSIPLTRKLFHGRTKDTRKVSAKFGEKAEGK